MILSCLIKNNNKTKINIAKSNVEKIITAKRNIISNYKNEIIFKNK